MENSWLNIKFSEKMLISYYLFFSGARLVFFCDRSWILSLIKDNNSDMKSQQMIKLEVRHNNVVSRIAFDRFINSRRKAGSEDC